MTIERWKRTAWPAWVFMTLLVALSAGLAVLQYRWIGEISRAERERLRNALQADLGRLSRDFNQEIADSCAALMPGFPQVEELGIEAAYLARYRQWKQSNAPDGLFGQIGIAVAGPDGLRLLMLNRQTESFATASWPESWSPLQQWIESRLRASPPGFGPGPGPDMAVSGNPALIELPRFRMLRGASPRPTGEIEWLILEVDLEYVRSTWLPALLQTHLGNHGTLPYVADIVNAAAPSQVILQTPEGRRGHIGSKADASVLLFDVDFGQILRRMGAEGGGRMGRGRPPVDAARGRWRLLVQHEAGSLEAIVARARWRNLAVSAGLISLLLATVAALVRFSRKAQQLADLQMNFVAGVSHELRTPLTVIRTAAFNLRGKLATRPEQVERYGKLIQDESDRLTSLVEQVLSFASGEAGHVIRERHPVAVDGLIEETIRSSRVALERSTLDLDIAIDPGLPRLLADEIALRHALRNLLDNAVKYGTEGARWIGVSAQLQAAADGEWVEIRIADRGPGIPPDELTHIFDPFFRGRRAVQDQIHGTGLGLNLAKKIITAHGGTIHVRSEPSKGTEFTVRLPAAPAGYQDEFADSVR